MTKLTEDQARRLAEIRDAQARTLAEICDAGPAGRTFDGRARRTLEALRSAGLIRFEADVDKLTAWPTEGWS